MKHNAGYVAAVLSSLVIAACGGEESTDGGLRQQYAGQQNTVDVIVLEEKDFCHQLVSNGKLSAASKSRLTFRSAGTVKAVMYREGDRVMKGDTIASLESAEKEYALEAAELAFRKAELDMLDQLAGYGYGGKAEGDVPEEMRSIAKLRSGYSAAENALKQAGHDLNGCFLISPFDGRIADMKLSAYTTAPSEPACSVINDTKLEVRFPILESEYLFVEPGLRVKVTPYADASITAEGRISGINPTVDENGQIMVTAVIENPGRLIDGMNVRITVDKATAHQLVVPKSAVVIRDNENVLFRYSGGRARWTYVNITDSNSESHSVEANRERNAELAAGDTVIVSGNLNIADGSEVTIKD